MLKGLLAALLIILSSAIWYLNQQFPVQERTTFIPAVMETTGVQQQLTTQSLPDVAGKPDTDNECISPQEEEVAITTLPFVHTGTYTCTFPESDKINQWRLQVTSPDGINRFITQRQSTNKLQANFFAVGTYEVLCQGRHTDQIALEEEEGLIIDGCTTDTDIVHTSAFTTQQTDTGSIVEEKEEQPTEEQHICGDNSALVEMSYLRDRILGSEEDETCVGTFYPSNDLEGIAGICCPTGKICDLNCDGEVSTVDMKLIEGIRKGTVEVELPGDGVDNTCDGQIDCGANPLPYCGIVECNDAGRADEAAFAGQSLSGDEAEGTTNGPEVYTNMDTNEDYEEVLTHAIDTNGAYIYLAVVKQSAETGRTWIELLRRAKGSDTWQPVTEIQRQVGGEINIRSLEVEETGIFVSYDLGSAVTFTIKKYHDGELEDITPAF